jgi:hypothetical protein
MISPSCVFGKGIAGPMTPIAAPSMASQHYTSTLYMKHTCNKANSYANDINLDQYLVLCLGNKEVHLTYESNEGEPVVQSNSDVLLRACIES